MRIFNDMKNTSTKFHYLYTENLFHFAFTILSIANFRFKDMCFFTIRQTILIFVIPKALKGNITF